MKIFVLGEGRHELGKWEESAENRATSRRTDGVLAEVFRLVHSQARVAGGLKWLKAKRYRAGGHADADSRTVLAAAVMAEEAGAEILVWSRDSDEQKTRVQSLHGLQQHTHFPLAGGLSVPCIEAWIVGLKGVHPSPEANSVDALKNLAKAHAIGTEEQMVEVVREYGPDEKNRARSPSLVQWVDSARQVALAGH